MDAPPPHFADDLDAHRVAGDARRRQRAGERQAPYEQSGEHDRRKGEAEGPDRAPAAKPRLEPWRAEGRLPEPRETDPLPRGTPAQPPHGTRVRRERGGTYVYIPVGAD